MNELKYENLYVATRDFLLCIMDAKMLYTSQKFTIGEESFVRTKLRNCFEQYTRTLLPKEYYFGPLMTARSREVVEIMITEFIDSEDSQQTKIAEDLDQYHKIINDSRTLTVAVL